MRISEQKAVELFLIKCIEKARELPLIEARAFLKGMLLSIQPDSPNINIIRSAYNNLCECDSQLSFFDVKEESNP